MVGTCPTYGRLQNTSQDYRVGAEGIQEEAKDKLAGHSEMHPEECGCHLGVSQVTGGRQDRMASTCAYYGLQDRGIYR